MNFLRRLAATTRAAWQPGEGASSRATAQRAAAAGDASGGSHAALTFADFRSPDADMMARWTVSKDSDFGGQSTCTFTQEAVDASSSSASPSGGDETVHCAVVSGNLSTVLSDSKLKRTGFAGVVYELPSSAANIGDHDVLEVLVRSDGRRWAVNVLPDSWVTDDLYQGFLTGVPAGKWVVAEMPFRELLLTGRGYVKEHQRKFDTHVINAIGFSLADNKDGPFRLEVQYVKARRS